jgi:RNA polymerase sigma factor (sigma-70 family)
MELERYRELAFGTALSLLGDHHLAEDAVQEALVEAHRCWDRLERPGARAAWIRAIVRHCCYRFLRKRDLGGAPLPDVAVDDEPWRAAAHNEQRERLLARVRALPRPLREVVVLHHLRGCPHKDVAAFLDLPATTVNNRLHLARRLLKGDPVNFDTPDTGTVLAVDGPLVDVRFAPDAAPDVFDVVASADGATMRVAQVPGNEIARCVVTDGAPPPVGANVVHRTAAGGTYAAARTSDERLAEVVSALCEEAGALRETGIKPIDLFCPLPDRGSVAIFGTVGTGKVVLAMELAHRLGGATPRVFYLADPTEHALIRYLREEGDTFDPETVWLMSNRVTDPEFAATTELFDVRLFCSPLLGIRGLWPAVDPFHSSSRVRGAPRHMDLAGRARDLIRAARELTFDPVLLEYLACRAYGAAKRRLAALPERVAALDPGDRRTVERARRLEAFLTNPFFVVEEETGTKAQSVTLGDTLDGVEAILDGACDDVTVENLWFVGALP